jgi:hypothetical protein
MFRSRTVVIPLLKEFRVITDSDSYQYVDLEVPALIGLLPHAEAIDLLYVTADPADSDVAWNIELFYGFDRNHEAASAVPILGSDITTVAPNRATSGITSDKYQMHARTRLRYKRATASGTRKALLSAVHLVRTVGQ